MLYFLGKLLLCIVGLAVGMWALFYIAIGIIYIWSIVYIAINKNR